MLTPSKNLIIEKGHVNDAFDLNTLDTPSVVVVTSNNQ